MTGKIDELLAQEQERQTLEEEHRLSRRDDCEFNGHSRCPECEACWDCEGPLKGCWRCKQLHEKLLQLEATEP